MSFSSILYSPVHFPLPTPHRNRHGRGAPSVPAAIPPITAAVDPSAVSRAMDGTTIAVIGGGSVAALAAVLSLADPEKRRQMQAEEVGGGGKEVVREYFNNDGFQRWRRIYGDADDVNKVQRDIRLGHSKTVENVMKILLDEGPLSGVTVCDAGCGTGSLSIPLAKEGAVVAASDISAAMVAEAEKQVIKLLGFFKFHLQWGFLSWFMHRHSFDVVFPLVVKQRRSYSGARGVGPDPTPPEPPAPKPSPPHFAPAQPPAHAGRSAQATAQASGGEDSPAPQPNGQ